MIRAVEKLLTFKPNSLDHGALVGREHRRFRFGQEFALELDGVWLPQASNVTALFIHGNRHNLTKFGEHYDLFRQLGISCLAFDFPGYGNSSGTPSEPALYASARAAYSWLRHERQVTPSSIIIYGCSLGGAVALELAQNYEAACLITESAFTNSHDMAKHLYPFLPIQRVLPKRFENDSKIGKVRIPHLLIHGERDSLVPVCMARALYELAADPKQLIVVPEAAHTDTLVIGGQRLAREIGVFIGHSTKLL
jgi:pimeloyl-ACP methyl ester carboxylesterase